LYSLLFSFFSNKILKELYFENSLLYAELQVKIGKSFPTKADLIEELIGDKKVQETDYAASTGGSCALSCAIQKNEIYLIWVTMDEFETKHEIMGSEHNFVSAI
jgi:hypothetical protein